jgi:phosphate transport system protein
MERRVDIELRELRQDLVSMAGLAEAAIGKAVRALVVRNQKLAAEVLRNETAINEMEIRIDERCMRLFALHQPEAGDLRFIAMALKINGDLERIGDLAVNIAQRVQELLREPVLKPLIDLPRMAELSQKMLHDSLDAFVQGNAELARDVCRRDDEVDDLGDQIFRELLTYMLEDASTITRGLHLILISRHLERVADHATNISEDVIYLIQGKTIKHHVAEADEG